MKLRTNVYILMNPPAPKPKPRPMLAVLFPNGKVLHGPLPETSWGIDRFIGKCGEPRPINPEFPEDPPLMDYNPYSYRRLSPDEGIQTGDGTVLTCDTCAFMFELTACPDNPFGVYWPQNLLVACGLSSRLVYDDEDDEDDDYPMFDKDWEPRS